MSDEVPEADAQEQRTPVRPSAESSPAGSRPIEVPEADYLEQQVPLLAGEGRPPFGADSEASNEDVLEQGTALPGDDDDEEYPPRPAGLEAEE